MEPGFWRRFIFPRIEDSAADAGTAGVISVFVFIREMEREILLVEDFGVCCGIVLLTAIGDLPRVFRPPRLSWFVSRGEDEERLDGGVGRGGTDRKSLFGYLT
jgi:hypothetical protein